MVHALNKRKLAAAVQLDLLRLLVQYIFPVHGVAIAGQRYLLKSRHPVLYGQPHAIYPLAVIAVIKVIIPQLGVLPGLHLFYRGPHRGAVGQRHIVVGNDSRGFLGQRRLVLGALQHLLRHPLGGKDLLTSSAPHRQQQYRRQQQRQNSLVHGFLSSFRFCSLHRSSGSARRMHHPCHVCHLHRSTGSRPSAHCW